MKSVMIKVRSSSQLGSPHFAHLDASVATDVEDPDLRLERRSVRDPGSVRRPHGPQRFRVDLAHPDARAADPASVVPRAVREPQAGGCHLRRDDPVVRRPAVGDRRAIGCIRTERASQEERASTSGRRDRPKGESEVAVRRVQDRAAIRTEAGSPDRPALLDEEMGWPLARSRINASSPR